jgi:hypothetical protein
VVFDFGAGVPINRIRFYPRLSRREDRPLIESMYVTPILDFGQAVTWGKIRWDGLVPQGTRIEIRTRTGQGVLVQPGTYVYKLTLNSAKQHTQTGAVAVAY